MIQLLLGICQYLQGTAGWQLESGHTVSLNIPTSNTGNDQRGAMIPNCNTLRQQISHSSPRSTAANKFVCTILMNESALV